MKLATQDTGAPGTSVHEDGTARSVKARGTRVASAAPGTTRQLLWGGVLATPLFYLMVIIQMLARPGFDIRRHPLSLLSLGDLGGIQIATFVLTGLAGVACAVGMRRALRHGRGGTWAPLLVGLWGLGLIVAGIFLPDAAAGFPPGAGKV